MSKPEADPSSGISLGDALRLSKRHPAYRRREAQSGSYTERENLAGDAKGKGASGGAGARYGQGATRGAANGCRRSDAKPGRIQVTGGKSTKISITGGALLVVIGTEGKAGGGAP